MAFSGLGAGTSGDPYQVTSEAQFVEVSDYPTAYFIQMNDIALVGVYIDAVIPDWFDGYYDGGGYVITGLNITCTGGSGIGLFAAIRNGSTLTRIRVSGTIVITGCTYVGLLVGNSAGNDCSISKCSAEGSISTSGLESYVGGFIGYANYSVISECMADVSITPESNTCNTCGGFIGQNQSAGIITDCYSRGKNKGLGVWRGGFAGINSGVIERSYSTGIAIDGRGFCWTSATETDCYWDIEASATATSGGTAVGRTTAEMIYPTNLEYTDWDFTTIWRYDKTVAGINDNYPMLRWQEYPTPEYDVDREFTVKMSMTFFKMNKNNYFDAAIIKCKVITEDVLTDID